MSENSRAQDGHANPGGFCSGGWEEAEKLAWQPAQVEVTGVNSLEFLVLCLAGWINRHQQTVIEFLLEEVKVLKEQLGKKP